MAASTAAANGFKVHFGDWEGRKLQEIAEQEPERYANGGPGQSLPPNGESFNDFYQRVCEQWQTTLAQFRQHLFTVSHGGVIRALLAYSASPLAMSFFEVPYARISRIKIYRAKSLRTPTGPSWCS